MTPYKTTMTNPTSNLFFLGGGGGVRIGVRRGLEGFRYCASFASEYFLLWAKSSGLSLRSQDLGLGLSVFHD